MLKDKIVLITGATDGIGKAASLMLAQDGSSLLLHGKNPDKGFAVRDEIIKKSGNSNVHYFNANLESFEEIAVMSSKIHKAFHKIDVLINNAGIYEERKIILRNGIEKNFMVNYLAPFVLTLKLLDLVKNSAEGRIVNVSSMIHASGIDFDNLNGEKNYSGGSAYSLSKLLDILFTYELSSKLKTYSITVNALHPGVINTKLLRAGWGAIGSSPKEGAKRIHFMASSEEAGKVSGSYFMNDKPERSADISYDLQVRKKLWNLSLNIVNKACNGSGWNNFFIPDASQQKP